MLLGQADMYHSYLVIRGDSECLVYCGGPHKCWSIQKWVGLGLGLVLVGLGSVRVSRVRVSRVRVGEG